MADHLKIGSGSARCLGGSVIARARAIPRDEAREGDEDDKDDEHGMVKIAESSDTVVSGAARCCFISFDERAPLGRTVARVL